MKLLLFSLCLIVLSIVIAYVKAARHGKDEQESQDDDGGVDIKSNYMKDRDPRVNDVFISGLAHYCSRKNCGIFPAVIVPEPDNEYNHDAMAVYNYKSKHQVGYIPDKSLEWYREWCGGKQHGGVMVIYWDGEHLRGRLHVYLPTVPGREMAGDAGAWIEDAVEQYKEYGITMPKGTMTLYGLPIE